ncbi:hypothetical protein [Methylobacterium sp. A54F]
MAACLTDRQKAEIRRRVARGESPKDIAAALGLHTTTVLRNGGAPTRRPATTTTQLRRIRELAARGVRHEDIAGELGIGLVSVGRYRGEPKRGAAKPLRIDRHRRLIGAHAFAEVGTHANLAARFGLSSASSFRAAVRYARQVLEVQT